MGSIFLMRFLKIFFSVVLIALFLLGFQIGKIYFSSKKVNYHLQPWQKINPDANFKVLFAGDSTAVGTGLTDNSKSTAGYFSHDFPQADVENHSRNGLRLKGLIDILKDLQNKEFDLAILQIGGNDILDFTPFEEIRNDEGRVLHLAKHIAQKIIILHSGNIGEAPLLIWPFTWIYTYRSLKVREIYQASQDTRVSYIDIYQNNQGRDLSSGYAKDYLHLNERGYALWYSYIKNQLQKLQWIK